MIKGHLSVNRSFSALNHTRVNLHRVPHAFLYVQLGVKSKDDVLAMGIGTYNEECRSIVMRYAGEWEEIVKRMGRWIDFRNDYKTLDTPFMESVWWVFKQLFDKNLVYRGFKVCVSKF